jgi:hypothetical protein
MDAIERAVVAPQIEIVEQRAAWRQVFRDRPPLASRAQNIHDPVHHFADIDGALVAARLGRRDQRCDVRPCFSPATGPLFGIRLHRLLICQSPRRISRLRRARSTTGPAARSAAGPASCSPTPPVPSARSAAISARTRRAALSAGRAGRVRLSDRPGRLRRPGLLLPVRHENEQFPASFLPNNTYIQRVATVTERIGYTVAPTTLSALRA